MKKFTGILSPVSFLFLSLVLISYLFVIFQPSLNELLAYCAVDFATLFIFGSISKKLFVRLFPRSQIFFPNPQEDKIAKLSLDEKKVLLHELAQFPQRRTLMLCLFRLLKLIPAGLVVMFYWKQTRGVADRFVLYIVIEILTLGFFYSCVYAEIHEFVSAKMAEYCNRYNWSDLLGTSQAPRIEKRFLIQEYIALIVVGVFNIFLMWLLLEDPQRPAELKAFGVLVVAILEIIHLGRIYFLNRRYFIGGLIRLYKTFNDLAARLRCHEQELSQWVRYETEQGRLRVLGEIAGLVAHDLAGSLHVIQFCSSQIDENPRLAENQKYRSLLTVNTQRAVDLVDALRASLKNPNSKKEGGSWAEAQKYVLQLLSTQFRSQGFSGVVFECSQEVMELKLQISQKDLIHILYNLFKNSYENLLANGIENPKLEVQLREKDLCHAQVIIRDNGTGFSKNEFERVTAYQFFSSDQSEFHSGLGLRLTRRLIERNGGQLSVVSEFTQNMGTSLSLSLPL